MSRLFTFGCSFTSYFWPTWADTLGCEFDYFENWGQIGGGNQFIFNSLIECIKRNQLTNKDTVIIMWTSIAREDRWVKGQWLTPGSIYNQPFYDKNFIKHMADPTGYLIRDLAIISAVKRILESIGCIYHFLSMVPITYYDDSKNYAENDINQIDSDVIDLYANEISNIKPSVYEVIFNFDWDSRPIYNKKRYDVLAGSDWPSYDDIRKNNFDYVSENIKKEISKFSLGDRKDKHPTPSEHLEYIEKILPEYTVSNKTKLWISEIDDHVRNNKDFKDMWLRNDHKRF